MFNHPICLLLEESIQTRGAKAVKFLWKRKHFEERSWKRTLKHLTVWGVGSRSSFYKTWGRDAEAVKFLWKQKHFEERRTLKKEAEVNSEVTNFIWSWKRKQKYFTTFTSLIQTHCPSIVKKQLNLRSKNIGKRGRRWKFNLWILSFSITLLVFMWTLNRT